MSHSFPKALLAPRSPQDSVQTLALHPRPHRLLQLHLCQLPRRCSAASLDLCPSQALCLEGILQPYPSKALLQYPSSRKPSLTASRGGWSACSSGLGQTPPPAVLISCQTIWGLLEDRNEG